jgi:deazaflavin-dependent oxidoreductase (nitroreductase family)
MKESSRFPRIAWKVMSLLNRGLLARYGPNRKASRRVLVLKTIGRKTGRVRLTPLQYEELDGVYYVASARGTQADWFRNLIACPEVEVVVGERRFSTIAKPMTDTTQIADFLELRLQRHPHFMGIMLRLEGLPRKYSRSDIEKFSERLAIVELQQPNP